MPIRLDTLADDSLVDEAAGHADLLAADHHDLLAVEPLLGDDRGEAAEHVVVRVRRSRHPSRRYSCPYVPTKALLE
jgi:hypothetical protein